MDIQPLGCCFVGCVLRQRLLVASMPGSPAGGRDGVFWALDLVVRCSSTGGAEFEFWCPGSSVGSQFALLPGNWKTSAVVLGFSRLWVRFSSHYWSLLYWRHLSVVLPTSVGDCYLSGLWAGYCSLPLRRRIHARVWFVACLPPPSGVEDGNVSVPLMLCALTGIDFWSILASSRLSLLWVFSVLVQVLSCLALSVPVGVRSVFSPAVFSSLWLCLVVRI